MKFEIEFCGIHQRVKSTIERGSWDEVERWAAKKLDDLVSAGRLHKDHAYVGRISRLDARDE